MKESEPGNNQGRLRRPRSILSVVIKTILNNTF